MKKISPGFLWLGLLFWTVYSVIARYKKGVLYNFGFEYSIFLILLSVCIIYTYRYDIKKSKTGAFASFILSLTFWIPLINLIFCAIGSFIGYKSLKKIKNNPKNYGGYWFIIICFVLTAIVYITYFTGIGLCFSGIDAICSNIGFAFMVD